MFKTEWSWVVWLAYINRSQCVCPTVCLSLSFIESIRTVRSVQLHSFPETGMNAWYVRRLSITVPPEISKSRLRFYTALSFWTPGRVICSLRLPVNLCCFLNLLHVELKISRDHKPQLRLKKYSSFSPGCGSGFYDAFRTFCEGEKDTFIHKGWIKLIENNTTSNSK